MSMKRYNVLKEKDFAHLMFEDVDDQIAHLGEGESFGENALVHNKL